MILLVVSGSNSILTNCRETSRFNFRGVVVALHLRPAKSVRIAQGWRVFPQLHSPTPHTLEEAGLGQQQQQQWRLWGDVTI